MCAVVQDAVGNVNDLRGMDFVDSKLTPDIFGDMGRDDTKMIDGVRATEKMTRGGAKRIVSTSVDLCNLIRARELRTLQLAVACQDTREDNLTNDKGRNDELGSILTVLLLLLFQFRGMMTFLDGGEQALNMAAGLGSTLEEGESA